MSIIGRSKMFHLRRLKTKPALEVGYEKYVSDRFCGHEFTDEELEILSYGDSVKVNCTSKSGKEFTCEVMLKMRDGRYAWVPSFADDYGRTENEWLETVSTYHDPAKSPYCEFHSEECHCVTTERYGSGSDYKASGYWTADDVRESNEASEYRDCTFTMGKTCPHAAEWAKLEKQHEEQVKSEIDDFLSERKVIR